LFQQTGDVEPKVHTNGPQRLLGEFEQQLFLRFILTDPGMYLYKLQDKLHQALGVIASLSTICRTMKFMGCTQQVTVTLPSKDSMP